MSTPQHLAEIDAKMLQNLNVLTYFKYVFKTITGAGRGDRLHQEQL